MKLQCKKNACVLKTIECVNNHANVNRIIKWISDKKRKPAYIEFTEGPERALGRGLEAWIQNKEG